MALTPLKLQLIMKDISQAELARRAGVNRAYINRVVMNKQKCSKKVAEVFKEVAGIDVEQYTK